MSANSLTVGIPTYQGYRTLASTVESSIKALNQIPQVEKEIIICVNGEINSTLAVAKRCQDKYPELIRVLWRQDRGKAKAMNHIASMAQGDIIFFLDDDISLDINCLQLCYKTLITSERVKLVFARRGIEEISCINPYRCLLYLAFTLRYRYPIYSQPEAYVHGNCMGMYLEDFPFFSENIINDDQYLHILFWGQVCKIPDAIFYVFGVSSIRHYHRRYYRIAAGRQQMYSYFQPDQIERYETLVNRIPNRVLVAKLSKQHKIQFYIWRLVDWTAYWGFRIWGRYYWSWSRNTYDHQSNKTAYSNE